MLLTSFLVGVALAAPASQTELTVYNQGFGLVKEGRKFSLKKGEQTVAIEDVAAQIDPTSVSIKRTAGSEFSVLEQNYQYDLINPQAILSKSVGGRVRITRTLGGQKDVLEGVLVSAPGTIIAGAAGGPPAYSGLVIRADNGEIILDPVGEISVLAVPAGLISKPTLLWNLDAAQAGDSNVELSYITRGITWSADYVLTLDGNGKADFQGWVTLDNQSGATYNNAKLKLLAGDVNQVQQFQGGGMGGAMVADMALAKRAFREESLFEYHLYTLQRPATVAQRETKQLSLLEGHGLAVRKRITIDSLRDYGIFYPQEGEVGTGDIKPQVRVEFQNTEKNDLGIPLPKGRVRMYQRDASGSVQLLGEDRIDHTPRNETVSLLAGKSFDIVASRKRTNYSVIRDRNVQQSFEIEVRNRKETAETVYVLERLYGDWKVSAKSMPFTKLDANTIQFELKLKPNEVQTVSYTSVVRW